MLMIFFGGHYFRVRLGQLHLPKLTFSNIHICTFLKFGKRRNVSSRCPIVICPFRFEVNVPRFTWVPSMLLSPWPYTWPMPAHSSLHAPQTQQVVPEFDGTWPS